MQRETTKSSDFYPSPINKGLSHLIENTFYSEFDIFLGKMDLFFG